MIDEKLKKLLNEAGEKDCGVFIAEMKELLNEAEEKDVDALLELGKSYFSKEKDEEISDYLTNGQIAFPLLARALLLDNENPTAQYLVGRCYFEGTGVDENIDEGLKWMEEAANQTPPYLFAVHSLYCYYDMGVNVPKNHHKAANYLIGIKPYIELYKKGEYPANKRENPLKNCDVDFSEMLYYLGEYWCENNLPSQARPILKEAANLGSEEAKKKLRSLSGCYVATAVYGSYDCPEVWTLRRYRDYTLAETWYGRLFIKLYYAISPTLVKWFGKTSWFKNLWKPNLDRMIKKLNANGVENTPYKDKQY